MPFGTTTKTSEILEIGPIAVLGTHPPLGVDVDVTTTMWNMIVAFPVLSTVTLRELGERLADVIWKCIMSQVASQELPLLVPQSCLSPTCG